MKKLNIMIVGISLVLIVLLGVGVSYSLWNISVSQNNINTAMTSCFDITYSSESSAINLEKQYPISDEAGSKLIPYTFKITNNCNINAYYKINLETLNTSDIDTRFIKTSLNNTNLQVINRYNETEVSLKNGKVANTLKSGYLPVGGSLSFDLRVWLDYDTTINDIKNDGTDKWVGKIVIISSPVAEDEINKACQEKGGDLIDGGECRKYYVKINQQFDINNVFVSGYNYKVIDKLTNSFSLSLLNSHHRFGPVASYNPKNLYYIFFDTNYDRSFTSALSVDESDYPNKATKFSWKNVDNYYYYRFLVGKNSYIIVPNFNEWSQWYFEETNNVSFEKYITVDLTLMFGEGKEPNKEWCDKYLTDHLEYNKEGTLIPIKELGEPIKTSYYDKVDMFD